jgi:iron(III) transport system permease protein
MNLEHLPPVDGASSNRDAAEGAGTLGGSHRDHGNGGHGAPRFGEAWSRLSADGAPVLVLLAAVVLLFSLLPFGRLAVAALLPGGAFDPGPALTEIGSRAGARAAWHSVETSVASAAIALLLGAGMAGALVLTDAPGKRPIALLFVASMLIAPQVTALAFLTLAGPSSALLNTFGLAPPPGSENPLLSREGIILVLGLHHAPLVFVTLRAGFRTLPRDALEAAQASGAGAGRVLRTVVGPLLGPHLVAAAALAYVAAIGNFGIRRCSACRRTTSPCRP